MLCFIICNILVHSASSLTLQQGIDPRRLADTADVDADVDDNLVPYDPQKPFADRFDDNEKRTFDDTWEFFDNLTLNHNLTYVNAYGSLHGSYCTGGRFPWDDDADAWIIDSEGSDGWHRLLRLFHDGAIGKYRMQGDLFKMGNLKIWSVDGPDKGNILQRWHRPFLDISHMVCKKGICSSGNDKTKYNMTDIFPLQKMAMGKLSVASPRAPRALMEARYGMAPCETCRVSGWDHLDELPIKGKHGKDNEALCRDVAPCQVGVRLTNRKDGDPLCG